MLMVELEPLSNGARRNLRYDGAAPPPPPGWAVVPGELEEEAMGYLPFMELTVEEGAVTAVSPGARPAAEEQTQTEHTAPEGGENQE